MRGKLLALPITLLAVLLMGGSTMSGVGWCKVDPIVRLGGVEYQIIVSVQESNKNQIDGPLDFTFTSQNGTTQELLFLDAGYNGFGETVAFEHHNKSDHEMKLDVKHRGPVFPVMVEVYENGKLKNTIIGTSDVIVASINK